jgi:hypothetical protein
MEERKEKRRKMQERSGGEKGTYELECTLMKEENKKKKMRERKKKENVRKEWGRKRYVRIGMYANERRK